MMKDLEGALNELIQILIRKEVLTRTDEAQIKHKVTG